MCDQSTVFGTTQYLRMPSRDRVKICELKVNSSVFTLCPHTHVQPADSASQDYKSFYQLRSRVKHSVVVSKEEEEAEQDQFKVDSRRSSRCAY